MATEGPLTAAQIYEQITGGKGVASLADAEDGASRLTARMIERAQRINALRAKTMSGWRGGAGDAASDATLPLVQAAADDAVHLKNAQTSVGSQMAAFGTAKNSVKPVAAQPPEIKAEDLLDVLTGKGPDSYNTKVAGWQADSQANIEAFSAYHSASTDNGGQMPAQYAQLADSGAPISMTERATARGTDRTIDGKTDTGEWARNPRQTRQTRDPAQQDDRPGQNNQKNQGDRTQHPAINPPQNQVRPPGNTNTGNANTGNTHANSYLPKPIVPPAAQGGYEFGPTGQPAGNGTGNGTGNGAGWPGTGGFGGDYSKGTGNRPGSTVNQPGMRGPGSSTGARLPEERLPGASPARGSAGPRGANGLPMGAPAGGRGGKEEDREKKKAPYLQNPDPDETFGGFIEKPMPPVIGENRNKK